MKRRNFLTTLGTGVTGSLVLYSISPLSGSPVIKPKTSWVKPRKNYKCLFNHELIIITGFSAKDLDTTAIKAFIEKLDGTDVDAVMCCPLAWRTNMFPSEVDPEWKKFTQIRNLPKFKPFDYIMKYIYEGGDPVRDTLEACRKIKVDFFINYRMNDGHHLEDKTFPTHNAFWREHPDYWLADTDKVAFGADNCRQFNYMIPEVQDYYFSIIEELCTKYDVDGAELDFERATRYFHDNQIKEGIPVMTAFVKRIREMLDRIGKERGKSLKLSVRVPYDVTACEKVGLDVSGWDSLKLVDMINISPNYTHSIELGIEDFKARTKRAKLYGEMNFLTSYIGNYYRYTTFEIYRASAMNLFSRGVDGLSIFNYDYVPPSKRLAMVPGLRRITDMDYLKTMPKDYAIYPNNTFSNRTFPAIDEKIFRIFVADNTEKVKFERSVLRIETMESCADLQIGVWLNDKQLEICQMGDTELFPPVERNKSYPSREVLKFYTVPLDLLIPGYNRVEIKNLDKQKASCKFYSMELALYRNSGS